MKPQGPPVQDRRRPRGRRAALTALVALALTMISMTLAPPLATAATETIWGSSAPSGSYTASDRSAVELGTRFTARSAGYATGVRFYKAAENVGTHQGTLWSSTGQKLATVTFTGESSSGWQSAKFATRVQLKVGETYTVSYFAPRGRYTVTQNYAGTSASSALGLNSASGVYRYAAQSTYPTSVYRSSQYWVDVLFERAASPAPSATPSATATSAPTATSKPTSTPTPTVTSAPQGNRRYPTASTAGLPRDWKPAKTIAGDLRITTAGAVVEDLRMTNGTIYVQAKNVTLRRIEGTGVRVNNYVGSSCGTGLVIEDSTFLRGSTSNFNGEAVITAGGYTARNVHISGAPEGFRVGGSSACGGVTIEDSYVRIQPPDVCGDWHGDGIQGYGGGHLVVRDSVIDFNETGGCYGTAAFFYPSGQGNTSVDIDGLIVKGGGYPFRLGMPGAVSNLGIVDRSWGYGPIEVKSCSALTRWNANVVTLDSAGQPSAVRALACGG